MASRDQKDLLPELQKKWALMKSRMMQAGYQPLLTCTYRSNEEQDRLYAQGRTSPGKIVTNAKAGQSKHNKKPSEAFDIAIIVDGKLEWDVNHDAWKMARQIGEQLGLKNLYPQESAHFQTLL